MKKILTIFGILLVISLVGCSNNSITEKAVEKQGLKEFSVDAFRFGYSPGTITVNKGDLVIIKINNIDTLHGIRIPDLNVMGDNTLEFTADKAGEFAWYCANRCGEGHMEMKGKLIVK